MSEAPRPQPLETVALIRPAETKGTGTDLVKKEVEFVGEALTHFDTVVLTGKRGNGKSTLVRELTQTFSQGRPTLSIDCHLFDQTTASAATTRNEVERLRKFLEDAEKGDKSQPPILILDAGDYLQSHNQRPAYDTALYRELRTAQADPEKFAALVEKNFSGDLDTKRMFARRNRQIIAEWNAAHPDQPSPEKALTDEEVLEAQKMKVINVMEVEQSISDYLDLIKQGLTEHAIKVITTDHGWTKSTLPLNLKHQQTFQGSYNHELSIAFQKACAKLYLERNTGIKSPEIQDEILEATLIDDNFDRSRQLQKHAITPNVLNYLNQEQDPEKRKEFLAQVVANHPN